MDLSKSRVSIALLIIILGMGVLIGGAVYFLNMSTGTNHRILTVDAVPLETDGNAIFALRSENGTKYIETEPSGADITYSETLNYTSLNFRDIPAVRMSDLAIDDPDIINLINEAANDNYIHTATFEGPQAERIESRLTFLHNGPFIVFLEDHRSAVYLQYTITERSR